MSKEGVADNIAWNKATDELVYMLCELKRIYTLVMVYMRSIYLIIAFTVLLKVKILNINKSAINYSLTEYKCLQLQLDYYINIYHHNTVFYYFICFYENTVSLQCRNKIANPLNVKEWASKNRVRLKIAK